MILSWAGSDSQSFEIKGRTARPATIDEAITINNGTVHLRSHDKRSDSSAPAGPFVTIAGYAPTTMQMLMVRLPCLTA